MGMDEKEKLTNKYMGVILVIALFSSLAGIFSAVSHKSFWEMFFIVALIMAGFIIGFLIVIILVVCIANILAELHIKIKKTIRKNKDSNYPD